MGWAKLAKEIEEYKKDVKNGDFIVIPKREPDITTRETEDYYKMDIWVEESVFIMSDRGRIVDKSLTYDDCVSGKEYLDYVFNDVRDMEDYDLDREAVNNYLVEKMILGE
jgi:hypothetical protein